MPTACLEKQNRVIEEFASCRDAKERYERIIALGRTQRPLPQEFKIDSNRVEGCQSTMYLHVRQEGPLLFFESESDALISAGLAALLTRVYSGETAETILTCPPHFLDKLDLKASLSPGRANGLASIHLRMKQEALRLLLTTR